MSRTRAARFRWPILAATLLFGLLFALFAGFAALEYSARTHDERLALLLARHHLAQIHRLAASIESAFRGYVLTRQEEFLQPMAEAEAELEQALGDLGASAEELAAFQDDVAAIRGGVQSLLTSKRALLLRLYSHRENEVLSHIRDGKGHALSTSLRGRFESLEAGLDAREQQLQEADLFQEVSGMLSRTWKGSATVIPSRRPK